MMEVRALYGRLSCGWLGGVCTWWDTLWWEVGVAGCSHCTASSWAVRVGWDRYIRYQRSIHNHTKHDCGLCHIMATAVGSNGA